MIEFGSTLRRAREAKGMTSTQLAQKTHLMVQQIEALENEDFSRIAAPIYGRGFVKLYCEAVEIDPQPMIAEFMDIYAGNREPTIHRRASRPVLAPDTSSAPLPPPQPVETTGAFIPPPPQPAPAPVEAPVDFAPPPPPPPPPPVQPAPPPPAPEPKQSDFVLEQEFVSPTPPPQVNPSLFKEPLPEPPEMEYTRSYAADDYDDKPRFKFSMPSIPPVVWRLLVLFIAAFTLLWLVLIGCRAIYRATMGSGSQANETQPALVGTPQAVQQPEIHTEPPVSRPEKPAKPTRPRDTRTIEPLYID